MRCLRIERRSSMTLSIATAALLITAGSSLLQAQACLGAPSYKVAPLQLGAGATFTDGAKGAGVQLGLGARQGLFMNTGLSLSSYDGLDGNAMSVSGALGYDVAVTAAPATGPAPAASVSVCPMAVMSYTKLPSFSDGVNTYDAHETNAGGGVALGVSVAASPTISVIPYGTFSYYYARGTVNVSGYGSASASDSYGSAGLGIGLLLNQRITLRPSVSIPVGLEGSNPQFSFDVGFQLGSRQ